jgi:hypothetical protein
MIVPIELLPLIRSAFAFLEKGYGFTEASARAGTQRRSDCEIEYRSRSLSVWVAIDEWGTVWSPTIGRIADPGERTRASGTPVDRLWEYSRASREDLALLASRDRGFVRKGWEGVVVPREIEKNELVGRANLLGTEGRARMILERYAEMLSEYGEAFLRGDFSSWLGVQEYCWHWLVAGELVRDQDTGDRHTLEEIEARFVGFRTYIESLRRELGTVSQDSS